MQKVLILKGLPASGKSTYARGLVKGLISDENGALKNWKRINKDDLRAMVDDGQWTRINEKLILKMRDDLITQILVAGGNVVVDDTNLHPRHELEIKKLVKDLALGDVRVEIKNFDLSLEECIARDLKRPNSVGANVIYEMYIKYLKKDRDAKYVHNRDLIPALIVDIDGTAAFNFSGRGFFDWDRVHEDSPNVELARMLRQLALVYKIIYVSGRDEQCHWLTKKWLGDNDFPIAYSLFMRPKDDKRPDEIVKREIYDAEIKDKYDVWGVFDDRPKVVRMWKSLGLRVFDCGDGVDF